MKFSLKSSLISLLFLLTFSSLILLLPNPSAAQPVPCFPGVGSDAPCDRTGGDGSDGSGDSSPQGIGKINDAELKVPTKINDIISGLIQLAYAVAGIVFFFMFILGGLRYILAGGDEKAAASARATLTQAFIGLIVVVAAFLITQLVFNIFGIEGFIQLG